MKNLKKISRNNLKTIKGGSLDECAVDSDCQVNAVTPCAECVERYNGRRMCLYFFPEFCLTN